MNAVFALDREHAGDRKPQPFSQADENPRPKAIPAPVYQLGPDRGPSMVTEVEIPASDASGAIVAAAKVTLPPRTIELRILDCEGHEVFSRRRGDRSRKHK